MTSELEQKRQKARKYAEGAKWCHGHILLSCADYLYHKK